jgi:hypothetical protein
MYTFKKTLLGENASSVDIDGEFDNEIERLEAFFGNLFKTFYPNIDPEVDPDSAFLALVSAFDIIYGESASSVPSSCVPLSSLTLFAINFEDMEDLNADIQNLKEYIQVKAKDHE